MPDGFYGSRLVVLGFLASLLETCTSSELLIALSKWMDGLMELIISVFRIL